MSILSGLSLMTMTGKSTRPGSSSRRRFAPVVVSSVAATTLWLSMAPTADSRAAGDDDLGAAGNEDLDQDAGLRLDMEAHAEPPAGERPGRRELVEECREQRHVRPRPCVLSSTLLGERRVFDDCRGEIGQGRDHGGCLFLPPRSVRWELPIGQANVVALVRAQELADIVD